MLVTSRYLSTAKPVISKLPLASESTTFGFNESFDAVNEIVAPSIGRFTLLIG